MARMHFGRARLAAALGGFLLFVALALIPSPIAAPTSGGLGSGLGPAPVAAQSVPKLTSQIVDEAGVVDGGQAQVQQALATLLDQHNVQLYVAFIPSTGGQVAEDFARTTFQQNGLGGNDMLLLVAVNDHRYGWYRNGAAPQLSDGQVDSLLSSTIESRFRAGDYGGGVVDFASALGQAVAGGGPAVPQPPGPGTAPVPSPAPAPQQPADLTWIGIVLAFLLIVLGVAVVWARLRAWREAHLSAEERDRRTGQLARDANALLIRADDALHEAQQELGFAEAEFDDADVQPFRDAIAQGQADLKAAFAVRQQLDDDVPEDPDTRERMLTEIVTRCKHAGSLVEEQHRRVQGLRDLERTAPDVLAQLPGKAAALEARLAPAEATVAGFAAWAPASWASVKGNVEEARKRISAARGEAERGTAALAATPADAVAAAKSARRTEGALAQATTLLDAIDRLAATIEQAKGRLDAEMADTEKDVATARGGIGSGADAALTAKLAEAQSLLDAAKAEAGAQPPDVLAADRDVQRAHASADDVLAGLRAEAELRQRVAAAYDAAVKSAEMSVERARDFIATRRTGVGREARTRLAEAQRHLDQAHALQSSQLNEATSEARLAARLADEAYELARSNFDDWDIRGGGRRGGNDLAGAILGGIILGGILGGGRRGGGWGGTPWGAPWGGGGGFGGFGGGGGGGGWGGGGGGGGGGGSW